MNKVFVQTSVGELIDKMTILEIKREKISDKKSLDIINKEYSSLEETVKKDVKIDNEIKKLWMELKNINLKLWEIEDGIRLCEKNKKFNEKFIELARSVYKCNDVRSNLKLKINQLTGSNLQEVKQYTQY